MTYYQYIFSLIVVLFCLIFLGCSEKLQRENSLWGGRGVSEIDDGNKIHFFWQASGYRPPKMSYSLKKNVEPVEWQYAAVFVAYVQQDGKPYAFPFADFSFTPHSLSVEKNDIDFSTLASSKVIFYTDEQGNVRQLTVEHDKFDFFRKYSEGDATPNEVIIFWKELQKNNSESIVFWENEAYCPSPSDGLPLQNMESNNKTDQN